MAFKDFMASRNVASGTQEPLDMGMGTQPRTTFKQFMEQRATQPQVAPETIQAVQAAPTPAPAPAMEAPEAPTEPTSLPTTETPEEIAAKAQQAMYGGGIGEFTPVQPGTTRDIMYQAGEEWMKTEALPTAAGMGAAVLAMPLTAGMSLPAALLTTAVAAGAGGLTGEAAELKLKQEGILEYGKVEEPVKDSWDILERSAWRGGEEALWTLVPDVIFKGVPRGVRSMLLAGKTDDVAKQEMVTFMKEQADKMDYDGLAYTTADLVDAPLLNGAEAVASNSYFQRTPLGPKETIQEVRQFQEKAIQEGITEQVEKYMVPAKEYVETVEDEGIARYVEANMQGMNEFAVAGLVRSAFKSAEKAQKSVAKSMYDAVGQAMDGMFMKRKARLVDSIFLDDAGNPLKTVVYDEVVTPQFPVDLTKVREIGLEQFEQQARLLQEGVKPTLDGEIASLVKLADSADYASAAAKLSDLRASSRALEKAIATGNITDAAKRKRLVDMSIKELEPAMDAALKAAEDAGIVMPDGKPLTQLKSEADAIWKETTTDFQNKFIRNIINNTDFKNGSADKLGQMFLADTTTAKNIMKIIEDAKATIKDPAGLAKIENAHNAIKGTIVQNMFMPMETTTGKYLAPNTKEFFAKQAQIERLFGAEDAAALKRLAMVIDQQAKTGMSNYLGFAQRARETGAVMTTVKALLENPVNGAVRGGREMVSTVMFAAGAGRLLTGKRMINHMTNVVDPSIPEFMRRQSAFFLMHQLENFQDSMEATMTPEGRDRFTQKQEGYAEYLQSQQQ